MSKLKILTPRYLFPALLITACGFTGFMLYKEYNIARDFSQSMKRLSVKVREIETLRRKAIENVVNDEVYAFQQKIDREDKQMQEDIKKFADDMHRQNQDFYDKWNKSNLELKREIDKSGEDLDKLERKVQELDNMLKNYEQRKKYLPPESTIKEPIS